jgi:uncharacterized coiled-coil DUF342 family protein
MIGVGRNRRLRKKIAGWEEQIVKHRRKIEEEQRKPQPDRGAIRHWEAEIKNWERQQERTRRRLPEGRKK